MKIGFTYDLKDDYIVLGFDDVAVAEFDCLETITEIVETLENFGHEVERIGNIRRLVALLTVGKRWDMVFNIAEGISGIGREAQVPAVLEAFDIPYVFSDPLVCSLTLHKGMTKMIIKDHQIPTSPFHVIESISDLKKVNLTYPLFAKPVAEGTGKGIDHRSKVKNPRELKKTVQRLLFEFNQPVLVEEFLPGREFTVGIIGNGAKAAAVGCMEVHIENNKEQDSYSLLNKKQYEDFVSYSVPEKELYDLCCVHAVKSWQALGCRDGGRVDLRLDKNGVPCFIEVNPLAGLHPIDSDLPILTRFQGMTYQELIGRILDAAIRRNRLEGVASVQKGYNSFQQCG